MTIEFPKSVSKTSLNGVLAFIIAGAYFLTTQPGLNVSPKVAGWITAVAGLARLAVGLLQTDSDKVLASLPGQPPQVMAAHSVPDNPAATAVTPQEKSKL